MSENKKILNIAYSKLFDLAIPWNSAEVFETACKLGFDAVKGDVTPAKDGKLIMCHDSFFYFDKNGRVLEPGNMGVKKKMIRYMSSDYATSLEYANEEARKNLGYYAKVAELEELIKICSKYEKIAYITVRDKQIGSCVDETYRLLKKYDMVDKCIINSFSMETLRTMRGKDANIKLSLVFGPNKILTKKHIDNAASLGDCAVCVFWWKDALMAGEKLKKSQKAIEYAKEKGVVLHFAHGSDSESYKFGVSCGFKGFQCTNSNAFK